MKKSHFKPVDPKQPMPKVEHEMLAFWEKEDIFEKSVEQRKGKPKYVFFDGPPFANGLPHYGHILANALKDAVTRYWTMRRYYVPRVNGWDCHGLPVEYEIEKKLKLTGRKDIEKMGVARFNTECRKSVFRYTEEWEKLLKRIGRWVDFEHSYATLENHYMESIWWVFKKIWEKGMVYQGLKSMHICPRCETPLSNFEVTLGYKEVVDLATIVKFHITDTAFLEKICKGKPTSFVAWTTTPWSIPTTMGLAVGPTFEYSLVNIGDEQIICSKNRIDYVTQHLSKGSFETILALQGKDIVGLRYNHPFSQYKNHPEVKNNPRVWKTYAKEYVSVEDGTGIVTINGAFGEIDMQSAKESNLPIIVNVRMDGTYTEEMAEFAGMHVKDQNLDHKIATFLEKRGALLRKEPTKHSYPHCWRCDTPLLNYTTQSWFIRVTQIKENILKNNKKIHWMPEHIQSGRFGKWLDGARDWNISRNRFWGCPIPVWQCECGNQKCVGSLKELRENGTPGNTFIFIRHGEAEQNVKKILNSDPKQIYHLTEKGRQQGGETSAKLKTEKVDMLFSSPFARAKETAEIIGRELGLEVQFDQHLREHGMGPFNGKTDKEFLAQFASLEERYAKKIPGGESFQEVETRSAQFIDFFNRKYSGKTFVLVTHGNVIRGALHALGEKNLKEVFGSISDFGGITKIYCGKLPKREAELDLHKPYIDEIKFQCEKCGMEMARIPEVLDCWFESGAMPYAQLHYPFENKKEFEDNFPAHFIAEGLDQTRGWFYTLHVLASILFDEPAFKNCIVNGILLAADGEKLSKRKKNYPDPNKLFETHGVDSTRMFLYTSTAPLAEDVRFSEKHVEEIVKQFTLTLWNTYSFFVTYANIDKWERSKINNQKSIINNKLDSWILSELHALIHEMTQAMDGYNLTKATRPLLSFVDNLSNWYVRRSRRRFWKSENDDDKNAAYTTLYTILLTVSKLIAPFMPFTADAIYKNLTNEQSVHLTDWPNSDKKLINPKLNEEIHSIRTIVSLALKLRAKNNIKVRQPLALLHIALPRRILQKTVENYRDVILEELNVKDMKFEKEGKIATLSVTPDARKIGPRFGPNTQLIINACKKGDFTLNADGSVAIPSKGKAKFVLGTEEISIGYKGTPGFEVESNEGILVSLDTKVTKELKEEGVVREIIRYIQELRKKAGYSISDRIYVFIAGPKSVEEAVTRFADMIERETLAIELQEGGPARRRLGEGGEWDKEEEVEIEGKKVKVGVRK